MEDLFYQVNKEITVFYSISKEQEPTYLEPGYPTEIELHYVYVNDEPVSHELNELILGEWGDVYEDKILM